MAENKDWDFTDADSEFSLVEDLDILDSEDFEVIETTDVDTSVDEADGALDDLLKDTEEDKDEKVIEPATMLEEKLAESEEEEEKEEEKAASEPAAEPVVEEEESAPTEQIEDKKTEEGGETMAASKQESIQEVLKRFIESSPDFEAAAVVSADGFVIASTLEEAADDAKVGAMSAAILSLGERAASELDKGELETVFVEGENGYVLVSRIDEETLMVLSTTKYAKLGLVFYELKNARKQIKEVL